MVKIETNIYEIQNLSMLNCKYRKYCIRGLNRESTDYHKNVGFLIGKLSAMTKSPCEIITEGERSYIAQPEGFPELPDTMEIVGAIIKIEKEDDLNELDFDNLAGKKNDIQLALRFLQYFIQQPLMANKALWRPQAGGAYFNKVPDQEFKNISSNVDLYRGFNLRVVYLLENRIGICVDTSSKYLTRNYLPTTISTDEFQRIKGRKCLYQYGNDWYEIKITGKNDLTIDEILVNGQTLFEAVHSRDRNRKSPALIALPKDCTALIYMNKFYQERNVPSGLCKLTYTTDHPAIKKFHNRTIKPPHIRRNEIQFVVDNNLRNLTFGTVGIKLSEKPIAMEENKFPIPDIEFGNNKIISIVGSPDSKQVNLKDFGRTKKEMLYQQDAGPYVKRPLFKQYLILPNSIHESYGGTFISHLKNEFNALYPQPDIEYNPIIVPYNDSVHKSPYEIGAKILETIENNSLDSGFGVVMIPRLKSPQRKEDPLENLIMAELRKRDIFASVIHTTTVEESIIDTSVEGQESTWELLDDKKQQGKYKGYVKNVVLNKILLTNSNWPFVLKTPLKADLTIGIDVKNNTSGFTLIYRNGSKILFKPSESDQKERLSKMHMYHKIKTIIEEEQHTEKHDIKNIVIHRDGTLFPSEIEGVEKAINELSTNGIINPESTVTFVEIRKTSRNPPLRLFRLVTQYGKHGEQTYNPFVGTYMKLSESEAFSCNTGEPYRRWGTTNPLHIMKCGGPLPIEDILHDAFLLSNLTWTKIDDCSRVPMSIKMNDIRLRETAGDYDEDALKYGEDEEGEEDE